MAFIVPNAGNTGGGQTFANVNQSEPDSLDFEIMGNRSSWIRSGGTATATSSQVTVQAGVAVIKGVPYAFPSRTVTIAEDPSGQYRFDLLVVRKSGTSASIVLVNGLPSSVNPTLPQSRSTLGALTYQSAYHVDFDTDVVLYSVLRFGSTSLTTASLIDKRVVDTRPLTYTASAAPTDSTAGVIGDVQVVGGVAYTYLQDTSPKWKSNAPQDQVTQASIPVGTIVCWPGVTAPPVDYLPCDGSEYPRTGTYAGLYAVIGTKYGGSASTFMTPKLNDERAIYGTDIFNTLMGTSGGENSVKLTQSHFPEHKHTLTTNGADNTHNFHNHLMDVMDNGEPGGSRWMMAAKAKVNGGIGTENTRNTLNNTEAIYHSPQMGMWGTPAASQTAVPLKGKHIHLAFYIKAV